MLSIHECKYSEPIVNTNKYPFSKMCWSYTQVWIDRTRLKKKQNNSPSASFKAQGIQIFCSRLHFTFLGLDVIKYREETDENLQTKYYKFMGKRWAIQLLLLGLVVHVRKIRKFSISHYYTKLSSWQITELKLKNESFKYVGEDVFMNLG